MDNRRRPPAPVKPDPIKHPRRAAEQQERQQAERAQALFNARLAPEEIRRRLRLGPVAFEQFVARNGIRTKSLRADE
ncbi:hypothetical protein [Pseudomonas sp. USHLN015]|uniref:hypothetical protein n=1 Tax=Pseudomonas sp. USHLN015 TaxID=3081296 RepID=UPI00301B87AF